MKKTSVFRVDEHAWLTMGAVCLIALIILAFRYAAYKPCYPIAIRSAAIAFSTGNPVTFKAETKGGKSFEWNFGDGSATTESDPETRHTYSTPGKYSVVVTVDGGCSEMQTVVITQTPTIVVDPSLSLNIVGPDTAYINKPVIYEDMNGSNTAWEWHFEDPVTVDATTKRASHTFITAGPKKIYLRVNGRPDLTTSRLIYVIDPRPAAVSHKDAGKPKVNTIIIQEKPTSPAIGTQQEQPKVEEKPKAPTVSDGQLETMLMQVVDGAKVADDFAPYLCNNLTMNVQYNGARTTFSAMCEDLKAQKKKKVKKITVLTTKMESTNCIISMIVTVDKKKGFLGL